MARSVAEGNEATAEPRIARPVRGAPKMTKLCIKCAADSGFCGLFDINTLKGYASIIRSIA